MDLRVGPLSKARDNIHEYGLDDKIRTVLSDGFEAYEPRMGDTAVIAGMGGELIIDILANALAKGNLNGISQCIYTLFKTTASLFSVLNLLCHRILLLYQ